MEKTWVQRLEEARGAKHRETAEATCQAEEVEASSVTITVEELDSRITAQKRQLQLEADKVKRKAVEEARKHTQRELQEKHLEDMAKQVSGVFIKLVPCNQRMNGTDWNQFNATSLAKDLLFTHILGFFFVCFFMSNFSQTCHALFPKHFLVFMRA